MVPDEVRRLYQADYDDLERLAERVGDIVTGYCLETGFAMASRPGHVKTLKSSAEKLETGRYARWSDLEDLVAFSIIIPTRVSEVGVLEFLRTKFSESKTKSQNDLEQDPSIFRFGATRFIGHLKSAVPDNEPLLALPFEIQVRTAFEHAWSVTTRALAYKPDEIDWRFERIAAQLKASVEQLDMLVVAYKENAGLLSPQTFQPIEDQRRILEHFKQCLANNRIPPEGAPSQWGLFAKNVHALIRKSRGGEIASLKLREKLAPVLEACDRELRENGWTRTVSLFQFVLGTMLERHLIGPRFADGFYVLVTSSLEDRFPETARITQDFRCDVSGRP